MNKQYFLKKLSINKPSVFQQYSYDLLPDTFGCFDKITIECFKHGIFNQKVSQHLLGQGCPECGREQCDKNRALTTDKFIEKSRTKYGDKYSYEKTVYTRKEADLTITCPFHGDITIRASAHLWSRHGCPKCDFEIPRAIKKQKILEKAKEVHAGKYIYNKVQYVNMNDPVEIVCPIHGSFWQKLYNHAILSTGCPNCARGSDKLSLEEFISKSKTVHGDKYDYSKVKYETNASLVTITCLKHGDFVQRAASHLAGNKCKKCHVEEIRNTTEEFIQQANLIHGDKYDYSRVKYHGNKQHVEIVCPTHGSFWQKPNSHLTGSNGCRLCQDSKGERAVELCLKKYGINYIREYRLSPYRYRFDFFLPELNIFIEFNGLQHYKPVNIFGGEEAFHKTKQRDGIKKNLIKAINGRLIVIPHTYLNENAVEQRLIQSLKCIFRYWFVIDNQIKVFKTALDVYRAFNVPMNTRVRDLNIAVGLTVPNCSRLF